MSTLEGSVSAPAGTKFAQAKIIYTDGSKSTLKLSIPVAEGYIQLMDSVLLDGPQEHFLPCRFPLDIGRQRNPIVERPALITEKENLAFCVVLA